MHLVHAHILRDSEIVFYWAHYDLGSDLAAFSSILKFQFVAADPSVGRRINANL